MFTRTLKRLIAKIGIAAMLFTQLAVAAYACPTPMGLDTGMPAAMADDVAMPDCEKIDINNPNLCVQHCQAGSQSVQTTPHVSVPAIAMMPMIITESLGLISSLGTTPTSVLHERQISPPPLIRFGVLRI